MGDEGEVKISTVSLPDDGPSDFWKKTVGAVSSVSSGTIDNSVEKYRLHVGDPQGISFVVDTVTGRISLSGPGNLDDGMVRMSSLTIQKPEIKRDDEVDDDLFDTDDDEDDDEENMSATHLPSLDIVIQGHPLNQAILNPSQIDGIIISEVGRNEEGSMYVVATDAITGETMRLEATERLTAERDNARKLFDMANRLNQERATQISELKARLAALTTEQTEVEWSQPAEVGAMGQPRARRAYRW